MSDQGALTGKGLTFGGSLVRTQATGYGLVYFTEEMLNNKGLSFKGKKVIVSGSGNVAIYAMEKAIELGAQIVACSDSSGYIYDENGIDLKVLKDIKEIKRARIKEYIKDKPTAKFVDNYKGIWSNKCDIALPCATQGEIDEHGAKDLIKNGVIAVSEGANMPSTLQAIDLFLENNILFGPSKAANAGGVACSALEMSQNSMRYAWSFEEVDERLKEIMSNIFNNIKKTAEEYGEEDNLIIGANIAGFIKVANAMLAQGVV